MSDIKVEIKSLEDILKDGNIAIPPYQRPYAWTKKQLKPLLNDLYKKKDDDLLIMGGIIIHKDSEKSYIVDGQQRLISFSIIEYLKDSSKDIDLLNHKFIHQESINNISKNSLLIKDFYERKSRYPNLNNIFFVVVETENLDDAFSFFDSQNTRGKKLEVYDILKAHHLRFIKSNDLATLCAKDWEFTEKDKHLGMRLLLDTLLARGRKWSHRYNQPPDLRKEFKSQRNEKKEANTYFLNRYQQVALFDTWKYNPVKKKALELNFKNIDATYKVGSIEINDDISHYFPFQLTQTIEGGELFFWFTQKYHKLTKELFLKENKNTSPDFENLVFTLRDIYRWNTGSSYIYDVYRGALLFYFDKFGYEKLDEIATTFFYSLYWLRFKQSTVQYASIYKYIREEFNPFAIIKEASFPEFIINKSDAFLEGKYKKNYFKIPNYPEDPSKFKPKGFKQKFVKGIQENKGGKFNLISNHEFYKKIKNNG